MFLRIVLSMSIDLDVLQDHSLDIQSSLLTGVLSYSTIVLDALEDYAVQSSLTSINIVLGDRP